MEFFDLCRLLELPLAYGYEQICHYAQWYVAGFGDSKLRAHSTLPAIMSAWYDHAEEAGMDFPAPGTPLRRRVNRFITGLANRFPHVKQPTFAVGLRLLSCVAAELGFRCAADLYAVRDLNRLSQWARILTAHSAMLRPCEHCNGCRFSDLTDHGGFLTLLVGSREGEAKYKHRPRRAILTARASHLSAGFVLRVFAARVFEGRQVARSTADTAALPPAQQVEDVAPVSADPVLFTEFAGSRPTGKAEAWARKAFPRLRVLTARHGAPHLKTGRCLRAGGATDAFAIGMPRWWVKRQGGWLSDAVDRYNQPTTGQRAAVMAIYDTAAIAAAR